MDTHRFVIVADFRIRLPQPLYPYRGKESIEVCHVTDLSPDCTGWVGLKDLSAVFPPAFAARNVLNIPGPIYGAETDTCTTGPHEAPFNVLLAKNGQEFIFKQPSNAIELRDVVSAAMCECFQGYGADGDSHWRLSLIREWWRNRGCMGESIDEEFGEPSSILQWREGLRGGFEPYLRAYAFFVENGRSPNSDDTLPDVA